MKFLSVCGIAAVVLLSSGLGRAATRTTVPFDQDWRFAKGDPPAAEIPSFDDNQWRNVQVPHDWSIESPPDSKNRSGRGGGYFPAGIGWYRKHFTLPSRAAQRRIFIDFDGVMDNCDVWINGVHLGTRPNGSVSFRYELTQHLQFGDDQSNVVAVRVNRSAQPASRWYTGSGIERHVHLVITDPVHLYRWSTFVMTPRSTAWAATARVRSAVINQSPAASAVTVEISIQSPDNVTVATATLPTQIVAPGKTVVFSRDLMVSRPVLWSLESPQLYQAAVRVRSGDTTLDEETVSFGIREIRFDAATGFWLNGRNLKIKGAALHEDGGAFGGAVPLGVWSRRLSELRRIGVNAIRTAHNPPSPQFLDLCDRMGFLVLDEFFDVWTVGKNPYDYHLYFRDWAEDDTRDTVRRDRNHPSIIAYSAGNEIRDTANADSAKKTLRSLLKVFHAEDPSRPVTQALFRPNATHDYHDGLADMLDLIGQNYREDELLAAHQARPQRKILGTETRHNRQAWVAMRDHPSFAGQFLWAGVDYLGESPGWPAISEDFGLLDRTGEFKARAYQRQSWWSSEPMVHIVRRITAPADASGSDESASRPAQTVIADWTPEDGGPHTENVAAYSNCEQVELVLNGQSLGSKPKPADDAPRVWEVRFAPGRIAANCRNGGAVRATAALRTAGPPAKIQFTADQAKLKPGWDNVVFLTATVVDAAGVRTPHASNRISFQAAGPGMIAAVDNADPASHGPFQATACSAFEGRCVAILRATGAGPIRVTASSPGLSAALVMIEGQ